MTVYSINGPVNHTIILGAGYGATFTVGVGGSVRPQVLNSSNNYTGIASFVQNAYLTNDGFIYGSNSAAVPGHGVNGGVGVNLVLAGDHLKSLGGITGGAGGNSLGSNGYGNVGGAGGTGVHLMSGGATSSNLGFILGGVGGAGSLGYGGGTGGTGLDLSGGTLGNSGSITGGVGGANGPSTGATGGIGAVVGNAGTLNNSSAVQGGNGGAGYVGGDGGTGVDLNSGATLQNLKAGIIKGGFGTHSSSNADPNANGGNGGVGVTISSGATLGVANGSKVYGGNAGYGYHGGLGGNAIDLTAGGSLQVSGQLVGGTGGDTKNADMKYASSGGTGGAGLYIESGGTATLAANAIIGGGNGGAISADGDLGTAGTGGAGLEVGSGSFLFSSAFIVGGTGGADHNQINSNYYGAPFEAGLAGTGGVGLDLTSAVLINSGQILGGTGGYLYFAYSGASGGAGAYLNGGTLDDFANISGGIGGQGGLHSNVSNLNHRGSSGDSVVFGQNSSTLVVESTASFSGDIGNFAIGDTIDIKNMNPLEVLNHVTYFTGSPQIATYTNGTLTIDLLSSGSFDKLAYYSDGGSGTDIRLVACYLRGTRITTAHGARPIESLAIGDRVMTRSGELRPIRWIGRRRYSPEAVFGNRELLPIRIGAGALADGVPCRDLWVSPEHAMYIDGALIPAVALVNNVSIVQETEATEVNYYHIEFATHDVIIAEGAYGESFVDDESREMFDNSAEFYRMYPHNGLEPAHFCRPRIEEGEQLENVRRQLSQRARSATLEEPRIVSRGSA